jgi:hypothetical protein
VLIRDLWARADVGTFPNGYHASIKPHDVFFARLTKSSE